MEITKDNQSRARCKDDCPLRADDAEIPMLEIVQLRSGEIKVHKVSGFEVILLTEGKIDLSCRGKIDSTVAPKSIFILSPVDQVLIKAIEPAYILICRLDNNVRYCKYFRKENYDTKQTMEGDHSFYPLGFCNAVERFADSLREAVSQGLICQTYLTAKFTELIYLLTSFYSRQDLAAFFSPMDGRDLEFRQRVYRYAAECNTVKEMADCMNISEVGLRKKFLREFSIPPIEFIISRKKSLISSELIEGNKPLRQISEEYGFASQSCLTRFCKTYLGDTPSKIRNKNIIWD